MDVLWRSQAWVTLITHMSDHLRVLPSDDGVDWSVGLKPRMIVDKSLYWDKISLITAVWVFNYIFRKSWPEKMTVTSLTSYIPRIMINTPLFPQRNAADTKIICNVQEMIHFSQSIQTLSHKPRSRHHRVLWSPESIFNDFDIKQSLMFLSRGDFYHPWHTFAALLLWSVWGQCCRGAASGVTSLSRVKTLRLSGCLGCCKKASKKGFWWISCRMSSKFSDRTVKFLYNINLTEKYIEYDLICQI